MRDLTTEEIKCVSGGKSEMQRWQIMSETQTKIHSITAEVTINKAKSADKLMQKMTQYISS